MLLSNPRHEALAQQLQGRHIFITGGTGFVGKTLLDFLIGLSEHWKAQFNVTILSRNPLQFLKSNPCYTHISWLEFQQGCLEQLPAPDNRYTDVIHAAANTHLKNQGAHWIKQIVSGTQAMLEFALQCNAQRFLLTSSGAVYGQTPAHIKAIPEDYNGAPLSTSPQSTYGQAKRVAEQLCTVYHHEHGLETIIARCFAFSGKHIALDGPYAIGNFIKNALDTQETDIQVTGNGQAMRSYLDAQDMAHWLFFLLINGKAGDAYNVGSSEAISIAELAKLVSKQVTPHKNVVIQHRQSTDTLPPSWYVPSTIKAEQLGLQKLVTLEEAIQHMIAHHQA